MYNGKFKTMALAAFSMLMLLFSADCARALPSMLNNVPTTDILAADTLSFSANYYGYSYKEKPDYSTRSMVYGLEYGYKKLELGLDYTADGGFVENGGYPGKMAWNFKYRMLSEGSDPVSLAIGAFFMGSKSYDNQYYGASPYFVVSKQFKKVRLHLGYQLNILGAKEVDDDNKKSRGVLAGLESTIIKDEKRPVTLMLDYAGGPMATYGIGLYQPINNRWSWTYSYYRPAKSELPLSKAEQAPQHWFGVNYAIPLGRSGEGEAGESK